MSNSTGGIRKAASVISEEINKATDAGAVDSSLSGVFIGNTSAPKSTTAFSPDVDIINTKEGFSSSSVSSNVVNSDEGSVVKSKIRPANEIDLANLDESKIMDLPFIKAKSFDIAALLQVKPIDPGIRFRWVNWKNNDGSNYQMFKSIGFENANIKDVDQKLTPIGENLTKEDGVIKYFDVILMKVNVIRLMQAYKANIQKSLQMVGRWSERAREEARRTFNNEVSPDMLQAMKKAGHSVDFFIPTKEDDEKDAKNAGQSQSIFA